MTVTKTIEVRITADEVQTFRNVLELARILIQERTENDIGVMKAEHLGLMPLEYIAVNRFISEGFEKTA